MIGYVGYSAPFIICEGGMIVATTIITSPNKPTFNIIEREPVFVNPFITLMSKFSQSPPLEFAIHNIVSMRVFVNTRQWRTKAVGIMCHFVRYSRNQHIFRYMLVFKQGIDANKLC